VEGERLKCGVCCGGEPSPSYIVNVWWFGADIFGNYRELPPHTTMQPLERGGPERRCWRCECTQGARPHPGFPLSPPPRSGGLWVGFVSPPGGVSAHIWRIVGLLYSPPLCISRIFVLLYAFFFCFCAFSLASDNCPAKHIFLKYKWN
jgi:hypothetical protein